MTRLILFAAAPLVLAACSPEAAEETPAPDATAQIGSASASTSGSVPAPMPPTDAGKTFPSGAWQTLASGEGAGLFFTVTEGDPSKVHLFCPSGGGILVNVHAFSPVGSEERMSFGSGGTVIALVADPAGDPARGGVSGEGPVPGELRTILTGPEGVGVNYGSQNMGPLPPVPADIARDFVAGCTD